MNSYNRENMITEMHDHSLAVHDKIMSDGSVSKRERIVILILSESDVPLSDYQILQKFKPGRDNCNLVRPRITQLHKKGILEEANSIKGFAGTTVRTSKIRTRFLRED